jgi:hypothetical protein
MSFWIEQVEFSRQILSKAGKNVGSTMKPEMRALKSYGISQRF